MSLKDSIRRVKIDISSIKERAKEVSGEVRDAVETIRFKPIRKNKPIRTRIKKRLEEVGT